LKAVITDKTQKIYWAGGEPLMSPVHWEILEHMKDRQFFNAHMTYNTNATKLTNDEMFDQAVNYFKMFNSHVGISVDGIDEVNDYIRAGSDWKSINATIKKLLGALGRHVISLDITMTNLTFLQLPAIIQYAIDTGLEHCYFKNMIEFEGDVHDGQIYDDNTYLSVSLISPATFNTISNEVTAILANSTLQTNISSLLVFIQNQCIGREFTDHERQAIVDFEQRHNDTLSLYDIVRHQALPGTVVDTL
jgi:sulfatase maturation enzyme AslB (radical SAM superfamily)